MLLLVTYQSVKMNGRTVCKFAQKTFFFKCEVSLIVIFQLYGLLQAPLKNKKIGALNSSILKEQSFTCK